LNKKRIVVALDRLGTRGIWLRDQHVTTLEKYCDLIDEVDRIKNQFSKHIQQFDKSKGKLPEIKTMFFSDTLFLIFETGESDIENLSYVTWLGGKIIVEGIKRNIFFRGAMSIGDVYYNEGYAVVFGPAIDEVTDWYEKSEWIGLHAAPSMHYYIEKNSGSAIFQFAEFLLKYNVPIKGYPNFKGWAVNWPYLLIYTELNSEIYDKEYDSREEAQAAIIEAIYSPGYKTKKKKVIGEKTNWVNDVFSQTSVDLGNFQKFENTKEFFKHAMERRS
jgi:hypothetical protein